MQVRSSGYAGSHPSRGSGVGVDVGAGACQASNRSSVSGNDASVRVTVGRETGVRSGRAFVGGTVVDVGEGTVAGNAATSGAGVALSARDAGGALNA